MTRSDASITNRKKENGAHACSSTIEAWRLSLEGTYTYIHNMIDRCSTLEGNKLISSLDCMNHMLLQAPHALFRSGRSDLMVGRLVGVLT